MNSKLILTGLCLMALITLTSCHALLVATPRATSLPVTMGIVDTNSPNLIAYLSAAQRLNTTLDTTPYAPAISGLLNGLTIIASAFAGWYARHTTAKETTAATLAATTKAQSDVVPTTKV
jgi:hypothetical protein